MSKVDVAKLKSVRGSYKGHCTQDIKKAERLITAEHADITELTAIQERLSRRLKEITSMDSNILNQLETSEDIEQDTEEALTFQDKVSLWILKISKFVEKSTLPVRSNHSNSSTTHVILPKINIKPFSGDPLEW